jgi:HD-like signal output (HDOD) protein
MTKQQILFVDDEPMVLQGLQRILRPLRAEWDMAFAENGPAALQKMADLHFDVIVSDMRMPGMNGADLLREVMRRSPTTVRIVLSGHADRDLVAQCVGVAHQYISKPCDPEQLKSMVRNACLLAGKLVDEGVKRVIGSIDSLPSIPEVYAELRETLAKEGVDTRVVGDILQKDIGMTAKILKLVNSAFFGLRRTISSPHDAVAYLGIDTIKTLVLSNSIFDQSKPFQTRFFSITDLWQHCMGVAIGARKIAAHERLALALQEEAFVGGLLHDVGLLILASNFPDTYDRAAELILKEKLMIPTAEQEFFGVTHAEVGAYLLGLWGLPAPILKIVSLHHRPHVLEETDFNTVMVVHAADVLCGAKGGHPLFETGRFNLEALARSSLTSHVDGWTEAVAEGNAN